MCLAALAVFCSFAAVFLAGAQFGKSVARSEIAGRLEEGDANPRRGDFPRCSDCGCHDLAGAAAEAADCPCRCHVPGTDLHYERLARLSARAAGPF
jgi:hypothetical protein